MIIILIDSYYHYYDLSPNILYSTPVIDEIVIVSINVFIVAAAVMLQLSSTTIGTPALFLP